MKPRERAWREMAKLGKFDYDQLRKSLKVKAKGKEIQNLYQFCKELMEKGIIEVESEKELKNRQKTPVYRVVGRWIRPRTDREKCWSLARKRKTFSVSDLERLAEVSESNAKMFCRSLRKHGYALEQGWEGKRMTKGSSLKYRLVRDTGPNYPEKCVTCGKSLASPLCGVQHD